MIDGSEKCKCQLVFELQSSRFMKSAVMHGLDVSCSKTELNETSRPMEEQNQSLGVHKCIV